jgi:hypothetical protein
MQCAQVSYALSLNDVCGALELPLSSLFAMQAARRRPKNEHSHSNKDRNCAMSPELFWAMLGHLQLAFPSFNRGGGIPRQTWRYRLRSVRWQRQRYSCWPVEDVALELGGSRVARWNWRL